MCVMVLYIIALKTSILHLLVEEICVTSSMFILSVLFIKKTYYKSNMSNQIRFKIFRIAYIYNFTN